jgi:hypothetical protein
MKGSGISVRLEKLKTKCSGLDVLTVVFGEEEKKGGVFMTEEIKG